MREVKRSALVAQPPARMFQLISDVESYPSFVPWCTHARIDSRLEHVIVATLGIRRGPLHTEFTTRSQFEPDHRVVISLVRGPFKSLSGQWLLTPIGAAGCQVELALRFAFSNALSALVFEPLFGETAASLVDAFVARARTLWP